MPHQPANGGRTPLARLLLRLSALTFAIFWAAIIAGKLRISFGMVHLPLVPEIALAAILALTLGLALSACLLEEQRRANDAPAHTTTEGDNP